MVKKKEALVIKKVKVYLTVCSSLMKNTGVRESTVH